MSCYWSLIGCIRVQILTSLNLLTLVNVNQVITFFFSLKKKKKKWVIFFREEVYISSCKSICWSYYSLLHLDHLEGFELQEHHFCNIQSLLNCFRLIELVCQNFQLPDRFFNQSKFSSIASRTLDRLNFFIGVCWTFSFMTSHIHACIMNKILYGGFGAFILVHIGSVFCPWVVYIVCV